MDNVSQAVRERMRADWNARACEDAHSYVAFGRRDQDDNEFLSTAADVIRDLEGELKRLPPDVPISSRRALEIGCGPGRLMRPMSRHFGEIHGVDVSDEMIAQANEKLRDIPWAHARHSSGSDLAQFPSDHFDFVYSYAVFQHIPSADVVFSYLRETVRVLKPGGFARLQINGLPKTARAYTTWEGVRIGADEVHRFTRDHGVRLLSLTGVDTQYMWTSWQKPPADELNEVETIGDFTATVDGLPVGKVETFRTDPLASRYEVNFQLPEDLKAGGHVLEIGLGRRTLTRIGIEVAQCR